MVYIHGHLPAYQHDSENLNCFRYCTSHFIDIGAAKAADIAS